jgi:hypothetical protein
MTDEEGEPTARGPSGPGPAPYFALHALTASPAVVVFGALTRVTRLRRPVFKPSDFPAGFSTVVEHIGAGVELRLAVETVAKGTLLAITVEAEVLPTLVPAGGPSEELLAVARARVASLASEIAEALRTKILHARWNADREQLLAGAGTPTPPPPDVGD